MPNRRSLAERFAEKVRRDESGCWLWTGATVSNGRQPPRGVIGSGVGKQTIVAPRASWLLHRGVIPDGKLVLHRCDNPLCVNPQHLFLGTHQDNMDDMKAKRRGRVGETHGRSKLTEKEVLAIRASSLKHRELATLYSVTQSTISVIRARKSWPHLRVRAVDEQEAPNAAE